MTKFSHIKPEFNIGDTVLYCAEFETVNGSEYQERLVKICNRAQYSYDGQWGYAVEFDDGTFFNVHLCNLKEVA